MNIRVFRADDVQDILLIDRTSFLVPWAQNDFRPYLESRDGFGFVATIQGRAVGYILYRDSADKPLVVDKLAVTIGKRRRGVGSGLVERVKSFGRPVRAYVSEMSLPAQLFWKDVGFRAARIAEEYYPGGEAAYVFDFEPLFVVA